MIEVSNPIIANASLKYKSLNVDHHLSVMRIYYLHWLYNG